MSITELVSMIPDWLAVTAGRDVSVGLSREDALGRASVMRGLLRDGKLDPALVVLDEDLKTVFHALVTLVIGSDPRPGRQLAKEADAVYQYILRVDWPDDDFGEKQGLLIRCATAGWASLGLDSAAVTKRRMSIMYNVDTTPGAFPAAARNDVVRANRLSSCDALFATCRQLREQFENSPSDSAEESAALYRWMSDPGMKVGLFDEREFLLGELALIAAKSWRYLGNLPEAERWLDRSEANLRHTINAAAGLTGAAFERLALKYSSGRYDEILELLPSVKLSFDKLGMELDHAKSRFLEAMTRRMLGESESCFGILQDLEGKAAVRNSPSLFGQVLIHIGNHHASVGAFEMAAKTYEKALSAVVLGEKPLMLGELKWAIGDAYRNQGSLPQALESYRAAKIHYEQLAMHGYRVHLNLVAAEILLALDRPREAEWEILQALPTIEEQKMVPEGFAAVALLRESVKRRKADPNALRELREHLQKQN